MTDRNTDTTKTTGQANAGNNDREVTDPRPEQDGSDKRSGADKNPYWQECEIPDCTNEVRTSRGICRECQP